MKQNQQANARILVNCVEELQSDEVKCVEVRVYLLATVETCKTGTVLWKNFFLNLCFSKTHCRNVVSVCVFLSSQPSN